MAYTYVDEDFSACRTITEPENCRESFQVENEFGHNRNGTELLPESSTELSSSVSSRLHQRSPRTRIDHCLRDWKSIDYGGRNQTLD